MRQAVPFNRHSTYDWVVFTNDFVNRLDDIACSFGFLSDQHLHIEQLKVNWRITKLDNHVWVFEISDNCSLCNEFYNKNKVQRSAKNARFSLFLYLDCNCT